MSDSDRQFNYVNGNVQVIQASGNLYGDIVAGNKTIINNIMQQAAKQIVTVPYKFLASYDISDRDIFFGRDAVIEELIGKLPRYKTLIINGRSGSGKTSLINAGLIPRLAENGYQYLSFRDYSDPLRQLREHVAQDDLFKVYAEQTTSLTQFLKTVTRQHKQHVAVIFDQFERFFVNVPAALRAQFIQEIKTCLDSGLSSEELDLVFALREDFFGAFVIEFETAIPAFFNQADRFNLLPLNREEAREAILRPLKNIPLHIGYNLQFVDEVLLPGLMGESTGDNQIDPPHLQIVCNQLYESVRRRYAAELEQGGLAQIDRQLYTELGETSGILRTYLDDFIARTAHRDVGGRDVLRSMLKLMLETTGTRKFVSFADLKMGLPDVSPAVIERHIREFQDGRIIETRGSGETARYSLSHEVMVEKVQSWFDERELERKKAREILERGLAEWKTTQALLNAKQVEHIRTWSGGENLSAEAEQLLTTSRHAYEERRRKEAEQERRSQRLRRIIKIGIGIFLAIAAMLTLWALSNAREARIQAQIAQQNQDEADRQAEEAKRQETLALQNEEQARQAANISRSRELAAYARTALDVDPTLSFRLSEAAIGIAPTQQAEYSLFASLQHPFYTTLQWDQAANQVKISPNGQQLLAGATDAFQLWDLASGREIFHWRGDAARIRDLAFSPQGTYVIASYHKDQYRERPARFWYASTGEPIDLFARLQDTPGYVAYARMSPDERQLITISQEQIVTVWDLSTGQKRYVLKTQGNNVEHVEFSPDGTFIIAVVDRVMTVFDAVTGTPRPGLTGGGSGGLAAIIFSRDGKRVISQTAEGLTIWNISEGQPISTLAADTDVLSVEFSPDGQQVVTAATAAGLAGRIESFVQIWDVASGAELFQLMGHTAPVNMASYSPDGKRIVTASADKTARVWDATSDETLLPLEAYRNRELYVLKGHSAGVSSAVFAPDGKTIVTTSADRTVRIWDIGMHLERLSLQGHTGAVRDAQFSPDGTAVLTASDDQTAILWDAATGKPIYTLAHPHAVTNATFSPDGSKIVTVGKNHPVRVWSRATGEQLYLLAPGSIVVFSPDGKSILTVSQASGFLWDASTGRLLNEFQGHTDLITSAVFAPNGIHILTASYDTTARIWDTTGQPLHVLQGHRFPVYKAVYSPTGASIATVSYDGTIRLWNTGENRDLKVIGNSKILEQQGYPVTHAVFSPDGKRLVTAETSAEILGEPTMQIWDMQQSQLAHELQERTRNLQDGAFSQDSKRFVSASYDGNTARVWDVETGQQLYALLAHTDAVTSAVFSPDGKSILTAARDGTARIWPARWQEMLVLLNQQHVRGRIRQFTAEERQRYGFPD